MVLGKHLFFILFPIKISSNISFSSLKSYTLTGCVKRGLPEHSYLKAEFVRCAIEIHVKEALSYKGEGYHGFQHNSSSFYFYFAMLSENF